MMPKFLILVFVLLIVPLIFAGLMAATMALALHPKRLPLGSALRS